MSPSPISGRSVSAKAAAVTAGRDAPVEIDVGERRDRARDAVVVDHEPVDLLETARPVGIEPLARLLVGGAGGRAFLLPGRPVGLARHVGQGVEPVLGQHLDLVDRLVAGRSPFRAERSVGAHIAVRRGVERGRIRLQRMGGELLDIDLRRGGQALAAQRVVGQRRAVHPGEQGQPVPPPRLVRGHQRRGVLDRRRRPRQMRDPHLVGHDFPPSCRFPKVYWPPERARNRRPGTAALSPGKRVATVISRQSGRRATRLSHAGEPEGEP